MHYKNHSTPFHLLEDRRVPVGTRHIPTLMSVSPSERRIGRPSGRERADASGSALTIIVSKFWILHSTDRIPTWSSFYMTNEISSVAALVAEGTLST